MLSAWIRSLPLPVLEHFHCYKRRKFGGCFESFSNRLAVEKVRKRHRRRDAEQAGMAQRIESRPLPKVPPATSLNYPLVRARLDTECAGSVEKLASHPGGFVNKVSSTQLSSVCPMSERPHYSPP